jgi:hypothetical protein
LCAAIRFVAEEWRKLPFAEKQHYEQLEEEDRRRYHAEMQVYHEAIEHGMVQQQQQHDGDHARVAALSTAEVKQQQQQEEDMGLGKVGSERGAHTHSHTQITNSATTAPAVAASSSSSSSSNNFASPWMGEGGLAVDGQVRASGRTLHSLSLTIE